MADDQRADDFDWVLAQAKCNAESMFERLRTRVKEDVQKRNGLLDRNDGWKFEFHEEEDAGEFTVSRMIGSTFTGAKVVALVRFAYTGRRIEISGEDIDVDVTAIVTVDATGLCRLVVGEAFYSDWEIRKMALEQLFFEDSDESE